MSPIILHPSPSPPPPPIPRKILSPQMDGDAHHMHHGQPHTEREGWLIALLVFVMRCLIVCVCAVARSIVIVSGNTIPESLFDHPYLTGLFANYIPLNPRQTHQRSTQTASDSVFVPLFANQHARVPTPGPTPPVSQHPQRPSSSSTTYVVFVGRDVGYTSKSSLATYLVQGIPNNMVVKYSTTEDALSAYAEALRNGIVRRVKSRVGPDGRAEFISEHLSISSGIRDLDALNPPQDGHTAPFRSGPFSLPWPAKSSVQGTRSSLAAQAQKGPHAVAPHWANVGNSRPTRKHRLSDADTVLISPPQSTLDVSSVSSIVDTSSAPTRQVGASASSSPIVLGSDSDDEIDESYGSAHGTQASLATRSAHSSDRYYDSGHEAACRAYIKEEEMLRVANVSAEL